MLIKRLHRKVNKLLQRLDDHERAVEEQTVKQLAIVPEVQDVAVTVFTSFSHKYFPAYLYCGDSKLHLWTQQRLSDFHRIRGQKLSVIAPRGSAKSTWFTLIYLLYVALYRLENYIIIISDSDDQASLFLKRLKHELEHNEALRRDFPISARAGDVWRTDAIELKNGVRIESVSKGGKIRGRVHLHYRPGLIVIDDPQDLKDAYSEAQLDKDIDWLKSDVLKAGEPTTNVIMLGTALAHKCLVVQSRTMPGWEHHTHKQLIKEPKRMDLWAQLKEIVLNPQDEQRIEKARAFYDARYSLMNEGAEVLWESRVPLYDVMLNRYSLGERVFAQEEQGVPMMPGDAEFPPDFFDHASFWFDEWPSQVKLSAMALDPSKGRDSKQGDYQAFGKAVVDLDGVIYVEAWLEKLDAKALSDMLVELFHKKPVEAIALEENGFQELLRIPIAQAAQAKDVMLKLPVVPINNSVAKPVRIRRLTPYLAAKTIRFKRGSAGTLLCVDQIRQFRVPLPSGQHDDGPDMLEMLLRVLIMLSKRG